MKSLAERQTEYEEAYNIRILKKVPVILRINGRNFFKVTKETTHPLCAKTAEIMAHTLMSLCKQIDGVVFGYQFFDEITLVLQNNQNQDTDPWFNNRCQKICSVAASIATYEFNTYFWNMDSPPPLFGAPLFDCRVFAVPNVIEAVNNLIWRQQVCIKSALEKAVFTALSKKLGAKKASSLLYERNDSERKQLLWEQDQIEFDTDYPTFFRNGASAYVVPNENGKYSWYLDLETKVFAENHDFLSDIITSGKDVFRQSRDLT